MSSVSPAERLFQAGIAAYKSGDLHRARVVWSQVLHFDPGHALAWLSLARVTTVPGEQLFCLHQAGVLRPGDQNIRQAYRDIKAQFPQAREAILPELADLENFPAQADAPKPGAQGASAAPMTGSRPRPKTLRSLNPSEALKQAAEKRKAGDDPAALDIYLDVLRDDPGQMEATAEAVRLLSRQKRLNEAMECVEASIIAGNRDPGAYLSLAELQFYLVSGNPWGTLGEMATLPEATAGHLLRASQFYWEHGHIKTALELLHEAERRDPNHQPTLMRLAEVYKGAHDAERARQYLRRVVDQGSRSDEGKAAEEALLEEAPYIPRFVQTRLIYTLREVLGVALVFFMLAMLDAGLSVAGISPAGWGGILLGALGGYLMITATSSPAQGIFEPLLGGGEAKKKRETALLLDEESPLPTLPLPVRAVLGVVGGVILIGAVGLVLQHSLDTARSTVTVLNQGGTPDFVLDVWNQLIPLLGG